MSDDRHHWDAWLYQMKYGEEPSEHTMHWTLDMPSMPYRDDDPGPQCGLFYAKGGAKRAIQKMQNGPISVQVSLDLHHNTLDKARERITETLNLCQEKHYRTLLIIHGKGTENRPSTLKRHLYHWLKACPHILGFCSAPPAMGGNGALLVTLAKNLGP